MASGETVNKAESELIAQRAAENALQRHMQSLPELLKPMMYEVAEKVSERNRKAVVDLMGVMLGTNLENKDDLKQLSLDAYFVRQKRMKEEVREQVIAEVSTRTILGWGLKAVITLCAAGLVAIGVMKN